MEEQETSYAGFWRRFAAYIIDGVIMIFFINTFYWFLVNQLQSGMESYDSSMQLASMIFAPHNRSLIGIYISHNILRRGIALLVELCRILTNKVNYNINQIQK